MLQNPRQELKVQAEKRTPRVLTVLNRTWFDGRFQSVSSVAEQAMVLLLLNVYAALAGGKALNVGQATKVMRVRHGKTAAVVIKKAIAEGLIQTKPFPLDKRIVLLFPTSRLSRMIEDEMAKIVL